MALYTEKKVLITVKTYPLPSKKTIEASCTAGITDDGKWIRLFPLPFRYLEYTQQFKKYQWIEASVTKASDPRPESYKVALDSIRPIGKPVPTFNNWQLRKGIILPLAARSLCDLEKTRVETGVTLGIFKPRIIRELIIEPEEHTDWTEQELAVLNQQSMFDKQTVTPLEKIPLKFIYSFFCSDPKCTGHRLSVTDWEMAQAYRKWRRHYGENWKDYFRRKFEYDVIYSFDTYFYVGTTRAHPNVWIIVGLFYPHKEVLSCRRRKSALLAGRGFMKLRG
jgi:hypothetical protein